MASVTAGVAALGFGNIGVTAANPAGDGFDQKPGHVYLASGWQGDLVFNPALPAETIDVPVVQGVTGPTFARFVTVAGNVNTQPLPGRGRTPDSLDTTKAKLISIARENNVGVRTGVVEIPSDRLGLRQLRQHALPGHTELRRRSVSETASIRT